MDALSPWRHLEDLVGVPVRFAVGDDGAARTYAAIAHGRRYGIDVGAAQAVVVDTLRNVFGFGAGAVVTRPEGAIDITLDRDEWLGPLGDSEADLSAAVRAMGDVPPLVDADGVTRTWPEVAALVGTDSLTWALLRSSSRRPPFRIEPSLVLLAGRTDANPLSLVRRAHARASASLDRGATSQSSRSSGQGLPESRPEPARHLRAALLVHDSAAAPDTGRRAAEILDSLEVTARETLAHLERTPDTRTDVPALQAARRVLDDALRALGLDAPTPY